MNLRAKFKVVSVETPVDYSDQRVLTLEACIDESGDNKDWSKWTPSGRLEMTVTNEAAFPKIDGLDAGDVYWVDLSPV